MDYSMKATRLPGESLKQWKVRIGAQRRADAQELTRASRKRSRRTFRSEYASRAEQHARYIDCGPQAWDDRDSESGDY